MIGRDLGENFAAIPGQLRSNDVIVGHYRCPDYNDVPALLDNLCDWMKREFAFGKSNQQFHGVLIQAIVCHVYIEWIHPFSDGNGRTGRLAEFYIMLRGGNPDIASHILSNYYNQTRQLYYRHLDEASVTGDLSEFIEKHPTIKMLALSFLGVNENLHCNCLLIRNSKLHRYLI